MTDRTLREKIEQLIEDAMIDAEVDYPAGTEAGHSISWDSDKLLDDIEAAIRAHSAPPAIAAAPVSDRPGPDAVAEAAKVLLEAHKAARRKPVAERTPCELSLSNLGRNRLMHIAKGQQP